MFFVKLQSVCFELKNCGHRFALGKLTTANSDYKSIKNI
jgi:hypothetical protein